MNGPPPPADLPEILVVAGLLSLEEAETLPLEQLADLLRDPYGFTAALSPRLPAPALRWRWEQEEVGTFCHWVNGVLRARFDIPLAVTPEGDVAGMPNLLRLRLGDREEVCDWAYLNQARWMGAFCTIAERLLTPRGVEALVLETGDIDTVLLFCRSGVADLVREWLPAAD